MTPEPRDNGRGLDLAALREVNVTRCARWHGPDSEPWTGADWATALGGEAGEALNVVKKLRRAETDARNEFDPDYGDLQEKLGEELADTLIYLDLLANHYGIDLSAAVVAKFNGVSARYGFPEYLEPITPPFTWAMVPVGAYVPGSGELIEKKPHGLGFHATFHRTTPFDEEWSTYVQAKDKVPTALTSHGLLFSWPLPTEEQQAARPEIKLLEALSW